ncbi:PAS-domain containing protein [Salinarimonas sp.]|uniref:sensor histidine kinase n=1 Tax=Salinarimonas sp. TaxID=2766526 RepID=UPI0032D8FF1B
MDEGHGHNGRERARGGAPARRAALATTALAGALASPFLATPAAALDLGGLAARLDPQNAISFAFVAGSLIFALTTALFHRVEQRRWTAREAGLRAELADLRAAADRAETVIGAESQIVVSWDGRDAEPRVDGDPNALGAAAAGRRLLAFGSWLGPADAGALDNALARLRERGEAFRMTLRTQRDRFVDAQGRALGGQAILRLRDVTGDRLELLRARETLVRQNDDLRNLRALLEGMTQPVWLRDGDGRIAWANPAWLAAVEAQDLDDARARGLELLDRAERDEAAQARAARTPFASRATAIVAGARRTLDVAETPSPGGFVGIAVDVTELEEVKSDLQRQMQAHVRTLDHLPNAVAIFDARQKLVFHNSAYRALWGLDRAFLESGPSEGEILDRLRAERRLPEQADWRRWKADVLASYRAIEPQETWWHLPDRRTLHVVANPNPQGGLTYLFDDVSEHISLESRYNALMRVQGETLDALEEGVAVFGSDGRLKLANRAFRALWRLPEPEAGDEPHLESVVQTCRALAPDDEAWSRIRGAIAGDAEARTELALRLARRDGLHLDCAVQPLPDGATLIAFVDVTASVNVERALIEKNEALEVAARLREDFVHHVSYELRSPLTTIIGFAQLLGDETVGGLNERQREYAGLIMRSSGALLAIINDILDLASIDTGSLEISPGAVDIRETIEAAVRGLDDRIAEQKLVLDVDAPDDIGSFVADGKRVRQVLFNLLSNAVGFSETGQTVRLAARKRPGEVVFEVSDEGRGIPPEVVERVFDRFESHTLGTRHRGVGLGLSIVRSFVELHGGRVSLTSRPGSGTTVTCVFPADGPQRLAAE